MKWNDKLLRVYDICKNKFDIHIEKYEGIYEFSGECKTGDYYSECDKIDFYHMYNWMTSFITGLAPMFYKISKEEKYLRWANRLAFNYHNKIFNHSLDTMHDLGFLYSPYSVEMYKITGDLKHRETALKAADELLKRFDIEGKYIDAWSRMDNDERVGRAIVDCMMNIQLLFWAWKETGHTIYKDVAKAHADTTVKYFVREDYSVCHSFTFDRKTGEMIKEANGCGYSNGSHWARGTAWMVYGLAMTAKYLDDESYYDIATKIAEKYIECLKGEFVPVWDFRLPAETPALKCHCEECDWDETKVENCKYNVDTSATAIMACAMMILNDFKENLKLKGFGEKSIEVLCDSYFNSDETVPGILPYQNGKCIYTPYGDYFFVEALQRILFDVEFCW